MGSGSLNIIKLTDCSSCCFFQKFTLIDVLQYIVVLEVVSIFRRKYNLCPTFATVLSAGYTEGHGATDDDNVSWLCQYTSHGYIYNFDVPKL